ncbi:MAG: hypothetical protein P8P91_16620 [Pseudomonadales bacterium]|nr:hypothetical protein [Pseudomonadales bacterium]
MKVVKLAAGLLVLLLTLLILITPLGPVPGFFIGGTPTESPETWPDTSAVHEITLAVQGTVPRVVIIWVSEYQDELYIVGSADSGWVNMIGEAAPVEMRLGDNTYSLIATSLEDGWQPMMTAYVEKYEPDYPDIVAGFPAVEDAQAAIKVFKLVR